MSNLGIVLPTYLYNDERRRLADAAFRSLAKTKKLSSGLDPVLLLLVKGNPSDYSQYVAELSIPFRVILKTDEGLKGTEQTLAYGTDWLFENFDISHVTWMGDDALFNPNWLNKLAELTLRHPDAAAWSVYRSAFEMIHRTLDDSGEDILVRSICGHGMTLSRREWRSWGIDWTQGFWQGVQGDTLDLYHTEQRSGERWVTRKSYVEHTSPHAGNHCTPNTPEYARDFVADGE